MSINYNRLPQHIRGGVQRYIEEGCPVGSFLEAVISNDLREAFGRADDINQDSMFEIVKFFYSEAPSPCWGSPEKMRAWLKMFADRREGKTLGAQP